MCFELPVLASHLYAANSRTMKLVKKLILDFLYLFFYNLNSHPLSFHLLNREYNPHDLPYLITNLQKNYPRGAIYDRNGAGKR